MDLEGFKGWKVFTPNFKLPCSSSGNGALSCSAPSAGLCHTWDFLFLTLYPLNLLRFKSCCKAFPPEVISCGFFFSQQFSTTVLKCRTCVPEQKWREISLDSGTRLVGFHLARWFWGVQSCKSCGNHSYPDQLVLLSSPLFFECCVTFYWVIFPAYCMIC